VPLYLPLGRVVVVEWFHLKRAFVAQKIEFFVSEDRKIRGPVPLEQIRREFESGDQAEKNVLFRMEGCKRFLPGNAWDPLSDLFSAPSTLDRPDGVVAEKPPRDLATLEPEARDKLLWFVEDADGVMGPVTGAFVARGLMTGRIPITAAVALVSVAGWIRATALFPAALEGATEIRMRPLGSLTCPYCLEPVIIGSTNCLMCNENVAMGEPGLSLKQVALLVTGTLAVVILPLIIGAFSARSTARSVHPPVVDVAASVSMPDTLPSASAVASSASPASSATSAEVPSSAPDKPVVKGEILAQFDVPTDTDEAFVLARGHVAIVRRSALDVIDPKSGRIVTTSHEVPGARKLEPMQGALYALGASRIGALDPDSLRVVKWIDFKGPFLPGAANGTIALFPSVLDRSVIVVGSTYHVEMARFHFPNDIPALVAIAPDGAWAAAAVGDPRTRIDAVATFAPRIAPNAQIVRRTAMGDAIVALKARSGRAYAALAGGRIASVNMDSSDIPAKPLASSETCKEPVFVLAAPDMIAVGCRAGQAVALHTPATLEQHTRIELGATVVAMELSATGDQMLVATGAPSPGLFIVDLPAGETRRVPVTGEISRVAFGELSGRATAYSERLHRVWVLE
jgi:hypothetical protein